jgi:drug/metabolite transporter superfamily protein YnfA
MSYAKTFLLFVLTAVAEIVGCYLPYLWLRRGHSPLLVIPAAMSLHRVRSAIARIGADFVNDFVAES